MDGLPEDDASYFGNLFCIHFIQYNDESNKKQWHSINISMKPRTFSPMEAEIQWSMGGAVATTAAEATTK